MQKRRKKQVSINLFISFDEKKKKRRKHMDNSIKRDKWYKILHIGNIKYMGNKKNELMWYFSRKAIKLKMRIRIVPLNVISSKAREKWINE